MNFNLYRFQDGNYKKNTSVDTCAFMLFQFISDNIILVELIVIFAKENVLPILHLKKNS